MGRADVPICTMGEDKDIDLKEGNREKGGRQKMIEKRRSR